MTQRVLVLAPPLANVGGIQRYTSVLVRALKDELCEQNVRCISVPHDQASDGANGHLSPRSKLAFGLRALSEVSRWRPQLIVCTHLALAPAARLLAGPRRRYWVVLHGIEAWARLASAKQRALHSADRLVVTSAFNREQVMRRHQIEPGRISSLPCVLDDTLLNATPAPREFLAQGPVVLTVGRMVASERYKGHDIALRALPLVLPRVPNLIYAIVGDGDDRTRLERLAKDLAVEEHVRFTGALNDSELNAIYRRSDVFLLPARTVIDEHSPKGEGFGIVFLEAMAFGKPVIGPNYGAPAELIRHGENGLLVDPGDSASVADAVLWLVGDPARARAMGAAGRQWVAAHHSYDSFRERLREVLRCHFGMARESPVSRPLLDY